MTFDHSRDGLQKLLESAGVAFKGTKCRCPFHDDRNASAGIYEKGGAWRFKCQVCGAGGDATDVAKLLAGGKPGGQLAKAPRRDETPKTTRSWPTIDGAIQAARAGVVKQCGEALEAGRWIYQDEAGADIAAVIRFNTPTALGEKQEKTFRPVYQVGGGWAIGDPPGLWPLYKLPELLAAIKAGARRVYVVEGEKAADAMWACGLPATTSAHGAKSAKKTNWATLAGAAEVVILPDHDEAGEGYAADVAGILAGIKPAPVVKIVRLADVVGPEFPKGGDFADFQAEHRDGQDAEAIRAEVEPLAQAAAPVKATTPPKADTLMTTARPRTAEADESPTVEECDPDIIPITDQQRPELLPDVLPGWARDYAYAIAEAKEVPVTMATLLMLPAIASTVQRRYTAHIEGSYHEPLMIYAASVMESGERKTAVVSPTYGPLFDFQGQIRKEAGTAAQTAKIVRELAEADLRELKQKYRQASTEDRPALQQQIIEAETNLPALMKLPQIIIEDFTEAALAVFLADNHQSGLLCSDEGGLFDNLCGRHSEVSEIDLFLKAHVRSPHTTNRIGRDNLFLESPRLSVGISPQPSVLARFVDKPEFLSRGLVARFLWGLPTSMVGHRTLIARTVADEIRRAYSDAIIALAAQDRKFVGDPSALQFSPEAYQLWKNFEADLEPRMGPDGDLRTIKSWVSKLAGAVARVAAVCHAANFPHDAGFTAIDGQQMSHAVALGYALIPHAIAVHRLMGGAGYTAEALVVAQYDQQGWPAGPQSLTEWWRPVRSIVGETSKAFEPVATKLVDCGYLICVEPPQRAGKKGQHFRANRQLVRKSESPRHEI